MRDKVDSLFSQISTFSTGRYYLIRWAWPCIPKVLKITNIQYLCNISQKEVSYEVDFLHADKHQSFLQVDTIFFDVSAQACVYAN